MESVSRAARVADTLNYPLNRPPKVRAPSWGAAPHTEPPMHAVCFSPLSGWWDKDREAEEQVEWNLFIFVQIQEIT